MRFFRIGAILLLVSLPASAQVPEFQQFLFQESQSIGEGWGAFTDFGFLLNAFLTLALATVLGTVIAYHPKHAQTADTLEEIEAPKVYIMYSVIGAVIGILVVKYGFVVGFAVFGIGGLIRFRTLLRSPRLTGQVIFVTLIGLSCGLDLPHVAVLATLFCFILIYFLDARVTYRIDIRVLQPEQVVPATAAYRELLEKNGCRIISEKKNPVKERIRFIFKTAPHVTQEGLVDKLENEIDPALKGTVDWEVD
jgi:hypothetical protein